MEEVIGFGVVGLLVISLVLGVRKLLKKKKDLFDYEDEIILDKKMFVDNNINAPRADREYFVDTAIIDSVDVDFASDEVKRHIFCNC